MQFETVVNKLRWIEDVSLFIWVILSLLLILSIYLTFENKKRDVISYSKEAFSLIVLIWLYSVYIVKVSTIRASLIASVIVSFEVIYVVSILYKLNKKRYYILYPVLIWTVLNTFYLLALFLS